MEAITQEVNQDVKDLLAQMQALAAPEPGEVRPGYVVSDGQSADQPAPAVVSKVKGAGWVYVYNTETGDRSRITANMLKAQLAKVHEGTNKRAFSLTPPLDASGTVIAPPAGNYKCLLHPDDPNRALYDSWRLGRCNKSNFGSENDVIMHMTHRHSQEWAAIERDRQQAEKAEDRKLQRAILEAAAQGQQRETGKKAG